jgi:hypothetical protein
MSLQYLSSLATCFLFLENTLVTDDHNRVPVIRKNFKREVLFSQ